MAQLHAHRAGGTAQAAALGGRCDAPQAADGAARPGHHPRAQPPAPDLARLCPNNTGADIRSVCTEAGMFAIRARRKTISEKDFLDAVNKVIKGYAKFSATPKYMVYN